MLCSNTSDIVYYDLFANSDTSDITILQRTSILLRNPLRIQESKI